MLPCPPPRCVVLVPFIGGIDHQCEASLRELERRGYVVRRAFGYSAIDRARSELASNALAEGFEELLWIDSDIRFEPESVERLRSHDLDVVCAVYPRKGARAWAASFDDISQPIVFGERGGLVPMRFCGAGFLRTRRAAYRRVVEHAKLPSCNEQIGRPMIPYFLPMVLDTPEGPAYLPEDYAFCQRLRDAGIPLWADTTIRLFHVGAYGYSWEDAAAEMMRSANFRVTFTGPAPAAISAAKERPPKAARARRR